VNQSYLLENQPLAHSSTILETLQSWSEEESDVQLISAQGDKIQTHRIFLKLYSLLMNSALQEFPSDSVPSIFIPASTASLINLIKILSTGVSLSDQKEDLVDVVATAQLLGIYLEDIQIGEKGDPASLDTSEEVKDDFEIENIVGKEDLSTAESIKVKKEKHDNSSLNKNDSFSESDNSLSIEKDSFFSEVDPIEENRRDSLSCYECLKTFANRDKLKRHFVIHTGEKPFSCDECSSSFTRKDKLTDHKNKKHNEYYVRTGHACHVCNKTHGSKWHLNRHLERVHSSIQE